MILQSLAGLPAFLVYFCTAIVAVIAYLFIYTRVTPHDEFQLIRDNDPAAAIALGLSLLGFVLPVVSAIAHSANVVDCLIWSAIALIVQVVVYFVVKIPVPNLSAKIAAAAPMALGQARIASPDRAWQRRRGPKPTPNARRADLHPAAAAAGRASRRAATSSAAIPHQAVRRPAPRPIPVQAASRAAVSARLRARSRRIFPAAVDQPAACPRCCEAVGFRLLCCPWPARPQF